MPPSLRTQIVLIFAEADSHHIEAGKQTDTPTDTDL